MGDIPINKTAVKLKNLTSTFILVFDRQQRPCYSQLTIIFEKDSIIIDPPAFIAKLND
jgi:hypothetical protein